MAHHPQDLSQVKTEHYIESVLQDYDHLTLKLTNSQHNAIENCHKKQL